MCEYNVTHYGGSAAAIRALQSALEHLFSARKALEYVATLQEGKEPKRPREKDINDAGTAEPSERHGLETDFDELRNLVPIVELRLTTVLRELVKACSALKNKGKTNKDLGGLETAKRMSSLALRRSSCGANEAIVEKCRITAETLQNLQEIKKEAR